MHCVHLVIHGQVQGVGYRYFVLRQARALGLSGWVRNRHDGGVETEAEGEHGPLEAFVDALREGPPAALVTQVVIQWSEAAPRFRGFNVTA